MRECGRVEVLNKSGVAGVAGSLGCCWCCVLLIVVSFDWRAIEKGVTRYVTRESDMPEAVPVLVGCRGLSEILYLLLV